MSLANSGCGQKGPLVMPSNQPAQRAQETHTQPDTYARKPEK
jgi:predicted small lipoprotein YifL